MLDDSKCPFEQGQTIKCAVRQLVAPVNKFSDDLIRARLIAPKERGLCDVANLCGTAEFARRSDETECRSFAS